MLSQRPPLESSPRLAPVPTRRVGGGRAQGGGGSGARAGFTLIELVIAMVLFGILAAIATRGYDEVRQRAMVARAIGDIKAIEVELLQYEATQRTYPPDLSAIGRSGFRDPWGNPYVYLRLKAPPGVRSSTTGQARKDRFLVPINSDFDLYSKGRDGSTTAPLTAAKSQDDIIRANDGTFIGVAADY